MLVKPAAPEVVWTVCGSEAIKNSELIPLSNDKISRGIKNMTCDIKDQVTAECMDSLVHSWTSLQMLV